MRWNRATGQGTHKRCLYECTSTTCEISLYETNFPQLLSLATHRSYLWRRIFDICTAVHWYNFPSMRWSYLTTLLEMWSIIKSIHSLRTFGVTEEEPIEVSSLKNWRVLWGEKYGVSDWEKTVWKVDTHWETTINIFMIFRERNRKQKKVCWIGNNKL